MESHAFDDFARSLGTVNSRRTTLHALAAALLATAMGDASDDTVAKKRHKKKKCKKGCGACKRCKKGKCKSQSDGTDCGEGATCQGGQCLCPTECCADADCSGSATCEGGLCVCPTECCADADCDTDACEICDGGQCVSECSGNEVCCLNVGQCKDTRNDKDFCGGCQNHQCPGSQFCANGACSLPCATIGQVCFAPNCVCSNRVDPAHDGDNVCAEISPFTCDNADTCSDDSDCGFQEVCISDICAGKNVCAFPCA